MKKITIPKETFKMIVEVDGKKETLEKKITDLIILCLRLAPSSQGTIDKIFEVGKLIEKLKTVTPEQEEIEVDNDDYKLIKEVMTIEMFKPWEKYQQRNQSGLIPNGWDIISSNPLEEPYITYLKEITNAKD